jgi:hypothetical protein
MSPDRPPEDGLCLVADAMDESVSPVSSSEAIDRAATRPIPSAAHRHRGYVVVLAAAVALLVGALGVVLARDDSPSTRVRVAPRQEATDLVPAGWKPVTFGTVQFAVPQDWPVYDDAQCHEETADAVDIRPTRNGPLACQRSIDAVHVVVDLYGGGVTNANGAEQQLNGLRAFVSEPDVPSNRIGRYSVTLPDHATIFDITFSSEADRPIIERIINTITAVGAPATATTGPEEYCTAIKDVAVPFADPVTGAINLDVLPYMERVRDAAPAESRGPLNVVIGWLQHGAPLPEPSEVAQARLAASQDYFRRCLAR